MIFERRVKARASRNALMVASVPELTSRTCSTGATLDTISSARSTSPGLGVPKLVPRDAATARASTTAGWA